MNQTVFDLEDIAAVCHEAVREYTSRVMPEIANLSPRWDYLDEETRESAMAGVEYAVSHPDVTPEQSHERWVQFKTDHGWTWGNEKNPEIKTHPCLKPYGELPLAQRVKDTLFLAIVKALTVR